MAVVVDAGAEEAAVVADQLMLGQCYLLRVRGRSEIGEMGQDTNICLCDYGDEVDATRFRLLSTMTRRWQGARNEFQMGKKSEIRNANSQIGFQQLRSSTWKLQSATFWSKFDEFKGWEHNLGRVIPGLNRKLISVGQLDKQGMEVRFGSNEWKVVKGNLVIARGTKHGSLYLVDEPAEGCMTVPVKRNKIWFAKSRAKRVHFANVKSGAKEMSAERVQKSKPFRGFGDSGSKGCAPGTVTKSRWVLKTRTEEFSPVGSLLCLESVGGPRCISGSGGVSIPVEIEDESLTGFVTTELELGGASTGPSFLAYSWELRLGRLVIEDYWIYWMTGLLMLDAGLDSIARPPSWRLLGNEHDRSERDRICRRHKHERGGQWAVEASNFAAFVQLPLSTFAQEIVGASSHPLPLCCI
ncbi:hypothetical protein E3N88_25123 [Mikania micrantha]|uniref:Uncharacterized protein n=1 Tax=Mikania micrantha TaxID=192012 RepID=A0A5N6N3V2_9ASTR|nr:hypothetical protein E3N88_25123 [Mikania micrantha]